MSIYIVVYIIVYYVYIYIMYIVKVKKDLKEMDVYHSFILYV